MKRLIDAFAFDKTSLPVVQTKKGRYTAPIKLTIKDANNQNLVAVHTKVLSTAQSEKEEKVLSTAQSEKKDELPVIRGGISDELTFRKYPCLKGKIPHSTFALFLPSFLDEKMDPSEDCITELSGMKKIEGLTLSDEDFGEGDEKVLATLLQSKQGSHEETSLAKKIKNLKVTDIYGTEKANGAYAACQVFKLPDGTAILFVASKTTPLFFEIPKNYSVKEKKEFLLNKLKERKEKEGPLLDPLLYFIAEQCILQLSEAETANGDNDLLDPDHSFWSGGMCIGEAEQGNHIIPLKGEPTIRWFKQTGLGASVSIESELKRFEDVGLKTVKHYPITVEELSDKEKEWRGSKDIEGVVVYYKADGVLFQIKYKAIPYIILRALREFLNSSRKKELLCVSQKKDTTFLSSANRPDHLMQVVNFFLEKQSQLLSLRKNTEFAPIVQENIEECKRDFPRFIRFLLNDGHSEKDLGYKSAFGIGNLYKKFKEMNELGGKNRTTKLASNSSLSGVFQGLIIAISGPPGVGKDAVAKALVKKLAERLGPDCYWKKDPLILSKDLAEKELQKDKKYTKLSENDKKPKPIEWLEAKINAAVGENRIIITTTCNGSPQELAWINKAAKRHNLAVMPVYPKVLVEDIKAFSAALIVSVFRRKEVGTEEILNSKLENIKKYINDDFYGSTRSPAKDFCEKYFPTELLSYFNSFSLDPFLKNTDLSDEKAKIQTALKEVVTFLDGKTKEISKENLKVLLDADEEEINKIFPRLSVDELINNLIKKIANVEKSIVYDKERTLEPEANYFGAFLDPGSEKKLKESVDEALGDEKFQYSWIKDSWQQKKGKKKEAGCCPLHLTLVHANSLHGLSGKMFSMLRNGLEVTLKVSQISYNKGVMYASNVRVLTQSESNVEEDVTHLLVQSGKPHITLATKEGIEPVYALFAEEAKEAGDQEIKTLKLDPPLTLRATVSTDLQNINKKKNEKSKGKKLEGKRLYFASKLKLSFLQKNSSTEVPPFEGLDLTFSV